MLRIIFELSGKKVQAIVNENAYTINPQNMSVVPVKDATSIAIQCGFERKQDNGTFLLVKNQIIVPIVSISHTDDDESNILEIDTLDEKTYSIQILEKDLTSVSNAGFNQKWIELTEAEI